MAASGQSYRSCPSDSLYTKPNPPNLFVYLWKRELLSSAQKIAMCMAILSIAMFAVS